MKKIIYFLSCFFFIATGASAQTTVHFKPGPAVGEDADIYMLDNNCIPRGQTATPANINYGNRKVLRMMAWTWSAQGCYTGALRGYLRFSELNTIPATATINSATLILRTAKTGMDQGNSHYPGTRYPLTNAGWLKRVMPGAANNWDEQTITWNMAQAISVDPNTQNWVSIPVSSCHFDCTLNLDVTDIIRAIMDDRKNNVPDANNGFLLQLKSEVHYQAQTWASSDYGDSTYWPELVVNYTGCLDSLDLTAQPNPACEGDDIQLSARQVPGADYTWKGPGGFSSNLNNPLFKNAGTNNAGEYILEVSNYGANCHTFDTINIQVNPNPDVDLGSDTTLCAGHIFKLSAKQNYTNASYKWSTGAITSAIDVAKSGVYKLTVTDKGCTGTDSIMITFDTVKVDLGPDTAFCDGKDIQLASSAPYNNPDYLWSTGATTSSITVNQTGLYTLNVTDDGCTGRDSVRVSVVKVTVDLGQDTVICDGRPYTLRSLSPAYVNPAYQWDNGARTPAITVNQSGTYKLTVKDRGCLGNDSVHLTFPQPLPIALGNDTVLCNAETITLRPVPQLSNASYKWSTGARTSTIPVAASGNYWLQVTDQYGCVQSDSIQVTYVRLAQNLGNDMILCREEPIEVNLHGNVQQGAAALWSTGETTSDIEVADTGTYWLTVSYPPCVGSDTITINTQQCDCQVYMPNAFSPNGDGLNDIFRPVMDANCPVLGYSFRIFNRWGQQVYYNAKPGEGWNGTISGKKANLGTYLYVVSYTIVLTNEKKVLKGDVILVR